MRLATPALLALALVASSGAAWADGTSDAAAQAHAAYERGSSAFRRGDYPTAAREYAAADALAPNPVALQAALDAAVQADDPVLGTALLDRARGAPRTNALVTTMLAAERRFAHRTGRVHFTCAPASCLAAIDGAATDPSAAALVRVGAHAVTLETGGASVSRTVTVPPDETVEIAVTPTASAGPTNAPAGPPAPTSPAPARTDAPPPPSSPPSGSAGPDPAWFWVAAGATVVAAGVTTGFAVDTSNKHASFARECQPVSHPGCTTLQSQGQSSQTLTDVGLGATAVLAAATGVLALVVHWHDASVGLGPGRVTFDARF